MVFIDENILLGSAVAIFIPLFVFLVKLIIEVGNIKGKIDAMCLNIEDHKRSVSDMNTVKTDLRLIDMRLNNIEQELRTKKGSPFDREHNIDYRLGLAGEGGGGQK